MDRAEFEKLWSIGNLKIHIDDKKAFRAVRQGLVGRKYYRSFIVWSVICLAGCVAGVLIMLPAEFHFSPKGFGFSWWGVLLFVLSCTIPWTMMTRAAQAVRNKLIRDAEFYSLAQEMEIFTLEEY